MLIRKTNNDTLFELRHTKEYEEKYEKEKLMKILTEDKLQQISTPLIDKIKTNVFQPWLFEELLPVKTSANEASK